MNTLTLFITSAVHIAVEIGVGIGVGVVDKGVGIGVGVGIGGWSTILGTGARQTLRILIHLNMSRNTITAYSIEYMI